MNAAAVRADRNEAIREAARAWQKAGAIDEPALKKIEAAYPDDRVRVGQVFRVLFFLFTLISAGGGFGFLLALFDDDAVFGPFLLIFGVIFAIATDMLITLMRRREGGIEAALSLAAVICLIGFVGWVLFESLSLEDQAAVPILFLAAALLLSTAAWRWGYPIYAGAAAASLLGAAAALPYGRLIWLLLPLALAPWLTRWSESERLPPAHRDSWLGVLVAGLVGAYVAIHLGSVATELVEKIGGRWEYRASAVETLWFVSLAGRVLLPVMVLLTIAYLAVGILKRKRPFLLVGLGTGVATVVAIVQYFQMEPLWAVLLGTGALLVAAIFVLRRYLESGTDRERRGFTTAPLFEDRERHLWLEAGAAAVTFAPEGRTLHEEPKFSGGGGSFGGGGSSSEF
ncbi:MAG TPA: hypothetical protein VF789_33630 [Thermoanaerobaculia bacterium]